MNPGGLKKVALCLGPEATVRGLERGFQDLGFICASAPEFGLSPLPTLADPQAIEKLKEGLRRFRTQFPEPDYELWIHPGVTVWAERPEILTLADEFRINGVVPAPKVLSLFGNKLQLLLFAEKLGIPNLVLRSDPILSVREIEQWISEFKERSTPFPFVLKSVKGESNLRLFVLQREEQLANDLRLWMDQLRDNSGEVLLFAERYVEGARHLVVPFSRAMDGSFKILTTVDVSLQNRFRKVIEVCPSFLQEDEAVMRQVGEYTRLLAEQTHFVGVGTVEFFVDGERAHLVEASARLNTEFHLWERVCGVSAVELQFRALGVLDEKNGSHKQSPKSEWPRALSLRLYAEDPVLQLPQPGEVFILDKTGLEKLKGEREFYEIDFAISEGKSVDSNDYGMIGSIWVGGQDWGQVLARAREVLSHFWIAGGLQTNQRFLHELLGHPWVQNGIFHASFIDEEFIPTVLPEEKILTAMAGVCFLHPSVKPFDSEIPDRWVVGRVKTWADPDLVWEDGPFFEEKARVRGVLRMQGRPVPVLAFPQGGDRWQVTVGLWSLPVRRLSGRPLPKSTLDLNALVSGRVHSILFQQGAKIKPHQPVLIIESMRTLVPHSLPISAVLERWHVRPEQEVVLGQLLAEIKREKPNG